MKGTEGVIKAKKVLDHGFVELVDLMGSDQAIVNAARTSYDKGTKKVSSNRQLIRYLMRHQHMGPFEFGEVVFRIRCPLFVARQWFRHRTGSYNEASLRYSEARDDFYIPKAEWITSQDRRNKQARTNSVVEQSNRIQESMIKEAENSLNQYHYYIEKGVAREIARLNLPLSYYTTFCYKSDLRNLMHFFSLRTDAHAQFEIRQYANIMVEMIEEYFPYTIEAWRNYHKESVTFSKIELQMLLQILNQNKIDLFQISKSSIDHIVLRTKISDNEKDEFLDKISSVYGKIPSLDYLQNDEE